MFKFNKITSAILCSALLMAMMAGCSSDKDSDSTDGTNAQSNIVSSSETVAEDSGDSTSSENTSSPSDVSESIDPVEIKKIYKASAEVAEKLAQEEKTEKEIIYTGFNSTFYNTPLFSTDGAKTLLTPIFSHSGLHKYIEENSDTFDFYYGDESFAEAAEKYDSNYFRENGVLIISFYDNVGGSGYSVTGAWEEVLSQDGNELDKLVIAAKRSAGDIKSGHLIIELNKDFITVWDSYNLSIYE